MAQIKFWNGSAWVAPASIKIWDGSAWVAKPMFYWNGSAWVEIFFFRNAWTAKAQIPSAMIRSSGASANGKFYVIAGQIGGNQYSDNQEYNPLTDTWAAKAPNRNVIDRGADSINGKVYLVGGYDINISRPRHVNYNDEYDTATNTWASRAVMPRRRLELAARTINGKLYAVGGRDDAISAVSVFPYNDEYNPTSNTWSNRADMPTARFGLCAEVVNGKLYAIGGDNLSNKISINEEYDPSTNSWSSKAPMPTARSHMASGVVNSKIYVIAGSGDLAINEEYDPMTNTWAARTSAPTGRTYVASATVNNKIYVTGGVSGTVNYRAENEEFS